MAILIISYDLNKKKDYPALHDAIKKLGTWCHVLDSTWLVSNDSSPLVIANHLLKYMDADDEIFVSKLSKNSSAWRVASRDRLDWLQVHM